ncbi:MAG: 2-phosphosulfolactate phosphatase [Planctomycetota bacterium]
MSTPIHVALLPELADATNDAISIVIDTLRFTTSACQALSAGASRLWVASEVAAVRRLAKKHSGPIALCGERLGHRIDGFDLGNSPAEYTAGNVAGKTLFFTTTNGTRAIASVQNSNSIWLACLLNRHAVVEKLRDAGEKTFQIVCAGTDRKVALEDTLAAGAIVDLIHQEPSVQLCGDGAQIALSCWLNATSGSTAVQLPQRIEDEFRRADGGINLIESGYGKDLGLSAQIDTLGCVPTSTAEDWQCFISG